MSYLRNPKNKFFILTILLGIILAGLCQVAGADEREFRHREFVDSRYHHDRHYPARGQFVDVLPIGHREVFFGRSRFFFFDGVWYRPARGRFLIVAPPIGLAVPFLPPYYSTIIVGGIPYYYANEVYYAAAPGGYVIIAPPTGAVTPVPPPPAMSPQGPPPIPPQGSPPMSPQGPPPMSPQGPPPMPPQGGPMSGEQLFIYPRQGQSEKKQADDRFECHRWAVGQTGYDPIKPPSKMPEAQVIQKHADYQRAMGACLDGRGYTVR